MEQYFIREMALRKKELSPRSWRMCILHYALDLWFQGVVKTRCREKAELCHYANDFVCVFRCGKVLSDAKAGWKILPAVRAEEDADDRRFGRSDPHIKQWFSFLGFNFYWKKRSLGNTTSYVTYFP
ncbi:MAG: hypothetical protein F9K48_11000 [Candidatus Brocadia sp.]|nr:MAG: hypothetical protein F9K48_11000 [Candidatus Brocadia sp.]